MKFIVLPLLVVFAILIRSPFSLMDAAAADKSCVFRADAQKVHLTVWDEDSEEDRQGKTFEGWLEPGDRKTIQSSTGFIVFSYKLAGDDRSYGDNHHTCSGGNTIRVP
ncbi:MAG: hypothetical protein JRF29_01270 [Deltaproteobacteria bacterium]|nr:hypothetical protein [Deltaproteobacteria bacterium]